MAATRETQAMPQRPLSPAASLGLVSEAAVATAEPARRAAPRAEWAAAAWAPAAVVLAAVRGIP